MLPTPVSVTVVWSEPDRSWVDAMFSSCGNRCAALPALGTGADAGALVVINRERRSFAPDTSPARLSGCPSFPAAQTSGCGQHV
jgi:hypothetical protein